jgi:multidrug transporter EmrE-like cation transporter
MTFGRYLKRPPALELVAVILCANAVHIGLGTLLWHVVPSLPWQVAYAISASTGVAAALVLTRIFYLRHKRAR